MVSHPMWVRGLKRDISKCFTTESDVAPYVGAWIETRNCYRNTLPALSHPMWVRGLKPKRKYGKYIDDKSHPMWVRGLKLLKIWHF